MEKFFKKHETLFCMLIIIGYVLINSYVKSSNQDYTSPISFILNTIYSVFLIVLIILLKRTKYYGLTPVKKKDYKKFLFFIPMIVLATVNLWNGININHSTKEILFYTLTMVNIGFLEEIIFRGFLFKMMARSNIKSAIIVSSITFGLGHIVNLLTGAATVETLMQICFAISLGFMLVMVFHKSDSLFPCILFHIIFDALGIYNIENTLSLYIIPIVIVLISGGYIYYIHRYVKG